MLYSLRNKIYDCISVKLVLSWLNVDSITPKSNLLLSTLLMHSIGLGAITAQRPRGARGEMVHGAICAGRPPATSVHTSPWRQVTIVAKARMRCYGNYYECMMTARQPVQKKPGLLIEVYSGVLHSDAFCRVGKLIAVSWRC